MAATTPRPTATDDDPSLPIRGRSGPNAPAEVQAQPLPRSDLPAAIAREIVDHIHALDLQPGDRLPSMQAFAVRFAVANPTVREALRRLQATGAVELRQGSGTYVGAGRRGLILANPHAASLGLADMLEILSARLVVEPHLAGLAAERADGQDLVELGDLILETERRLFPNDGTTHSVNDAFHLAIARIAREPVLAQIDHALLRLYRSGTWESFHPARGRSRDLHDHIGILNAIRAGDVQDAQARMRQHLVDSATDVQACLIEESNARD